MNHKTQPAALGAFLSIGILILDSKTALSGAQEGITLCLQTVIPSLFPFFVLSAIINRCSWGNSRGILRHIGRLFHLPAGSEALLVPAFLGGYPVGAQAVGTAYRNGQLKPEEAQRLLAFCNNPGPAFLFGMVGSLFPGKASPWLLWGILLLSSIAVAKLIPAVQSEVSQPISPTYGDRILISAIKAMTLVCAWVVLLRVVITFCSRWFLWILPVPVAVLFMGLLELSNGCIALASVGQASLQFVMCACMLAFGGVCVTMQTVSVTEGLSKKQYFLGKGLQTVFSLLLSICAVHGKWMLFCIFATTVLIFPGKMKKSGSIPGKAIV